MTTIAGNIKESLKVLAKKVSPSSTSRKKVIVIGSEYHVAKATLLALAAIHDDTVQAFAGTEDKLANSFDLEGIETVQVDLKDNASLARSLEGFDAAYIVVPGHSRGVQMTLNGIEAAKDAGVKFVLLLSVMKSGVDETTFAKEFKPVEDAIEQSGLDYALVRLPLEEEHIAVGDVGKESAKILADPEEHVGKKYILEASQ